ncbi:MAG: MBL fold metallo-hydrolase [Anaerolineae bacterium]
MIIETIASGPCDTNALLIGCEKTKQAAIIDAPFSVTGILAKRLKHYGLTLKMFLLTHSHWDHIADAALIKETFAVPLYVHPDDAPNVKNPGEDRLPLFYVIKPAIPDHYLNNGDLLMLGDLEIYVIHTPGHSPGGVCFHIPKEDALISGDTLFSGSIGNLKFPTARPALMWESLKTLAKLPKETRVYPGHGEVTTIGKESWMPHAQEIFQDKNPRGNHDFFARR